MNLSLRQILLSSAALLVALATIVFLAQNPVWLGDQQLLLRALLLNLAVISILLCLAPWLAYFNERPGAFLMAVCLPALLPAFVYYLVLLPRIAVGGLAAEQLQSQLITDSSSNGIIEVGFRYPIYTPTIAVTNQGLNTRRVNVFLRMSDGNGDTVLFRGVRSVIPGTGLSVESTVQGMLSENSGYLFIPLELPPRREVSGRVVFIISNLEDGSTFSEALGRAYQAQFELRDPVNGELLLEFPLNRI